MPTLLALVLTAASLFAAADEPPTLAIGSPAPDFALPGVDGKIHRLSDYSSYPVLVIVFTCNHCPTAQLYENRIKQIAADYRGKGVALVAISPNDPAAVRLNELGYTDVSDSLEDMKIRAAYRKFNFPYLYDGETQSVARAYGPKATPHVFIFDRERKLRYEGRVDNSQRESLVKVRDARNAIDALLEGRPVPVEHTGVFGCSTKWKSKQASREQELKKIEAEPVVLEMAGAEELKKLRSNPTGKLLLVNFWATWCGPCISELPDLITTHRMYRGRDFDFVTVSTNLPDERAGVQKVLEKLHSSGRNLQFASTDTYAMQAAFDAKWEAGVPYTVLLAPGGKLLYQKQGEVDILELRRIILGNLPDDDYIGHSAYWRTK
ncbi:MAG TPA: redoxin family protein [Bryobacteraceae bacterium]|nr:redoxin family protein [Bryobacteraceae bacterium]HOQ46643.1 redoxin family protein [Bryobacteraceae bacterium]HPQ17550.1 redoxin family protein [Bryobacteraceae bacterium]HPU72313.1 redoxin family protein [Bryobacteraceae bacterium]